MLQLRETLATDNALTIAHTNTFPRQTPPRRLSPGPAPFVDAPKSVPRYRCLVQFEGWSSSAGRVAAIWIALMVCDERCVRAQGGAAPVQESTKADQHRAEELYREGAALLAEGRYWEAEAQFKESFKLLKGRGTLLNLAICHENLGRLATAYSELKSLQEQAVAAGDKARLDVAREHLAWIEPRLSYLSVTLTAESRLPGVQVEVDGHPVTAFDTLFPIDPGPHQMRATAPGKKDYRVDLVVETGNQPRNITIPSLIDLDIVTAAAPPQPGIPTKAAAVQQPVEQPPRADYTSTYIAGATTLTLTAGAIASAFLYYDRRAAYHDAISKPDSVSDEEANARHESAQKMAWINGTLIVGAGVGAVVTGVLWYRASHASKVRVADGAWVAPLVVGSGAGLCAGSHF